MINLGHKQVGKSFPVFIDKNTKSEYALARKEHKISSGHDGFRFNFSPDITLEEDLYRRDVTINAIAMDEETGEIFDPYNGKKDIDNKVLKHVSDHFHEDPLRVLRVARFSAQLSSFTIDPQTISLMKKISESGELQTLSGERIYQELEKALLSKHPSKFFQALSDCGALNDLFPELACLKGVPQTKKYHPEGDVWTHLMLVIDSAAQISTKLEVLFSCLTHDLGKGVTPEDILPGHRGHEESGIPILKGLCKRIKVPSKIQKIAEKVCRYHFKCHIVTELRSSTILKLLTKLDSFRSPQYLKDFVVCCTADNMGKLSNNYPQADFLLNCFEAIKDLDHSDIYKKYKGSDISDQIRRKQIEEIKKYRKSLKSGTCIDCE